MAISVPVFLAGCGGANSPLSSNAVNASSASGGSGSAASASDSSGSSAGSTSSGSSDTGTSASSSGSSGSSAGSTSSGSSTSGTSSSSSGISASASTVPDGALSVKSIQKLSNWQQIHDTATGNSTAVSSGSMSLTGSPSRSGSARKFVTKFSNGGGERYWITFGGDTATNNFFYDAWLYIDGSAASIANIEMDMNQVTSNGQTVIYGFQCDGYSGTWDYTKNGGTPQNYKDVWVHANAKCNPRNWKTNTWHHVQIAYSRDDSGNVIYKWVALDGAKDTLNAKVPSSFALGWGSSLLTNFQVDGLGSGTATVYVDDLTISRW